MIDKARDLVEFWRQYADHIRDPALPELNTMSDAYHNAANELEALIKSEKAF